MSDPSHKIAAIASKYELLARRFHDHADHPHPFDDCPSKYCQYAAEAWSLAQSEQGQTPAE